MSERTCTNCNGRVCTVDGFIMGVMMQPAEGRRIRASNVPTAVGRSIASIKKQCIRLREGQAAHARGQVLLPTLRLEGVGNDR